MPAWTGESERSSFQSSSAVGLPRSRPMRRARSQRISMSSRTPSGGGSARRTRWTRRSLLVTVPSDSHQPAAAGNTTSASSAVAVRNMSCTTRNPAPQELHGAVWSGLGIGRVFADDVKRRQLAVLHCLEHAATNASPAWRDLHAPGALELGP